MTRLATLAAGVRRARTTELVHSTHTGRESHAAILARIYAASVAPEPAAPAVCRTAVPEPHLAGEFPLSCHACHVTENY